MLTKLYDAGSGNGTDGGGGGAANTNTQTQEQKPKFESFDKYLETVPPEIKELYESHTTGLKNTVAATRQERDDLAKQIKDLLPKAEKGSEMEKLLKDFEGKLELAERRANFVEQAVQPGVECRNPKAAYALAVAENMFTRRGDPDWDALKKEAPELFGKPTAQGNAGAGTETQQQAVSINDRIRQAAGH